MSEIISIPVHNLKVSVNNARKTGAEKQADKELKASIEANGLWQNLVVAPANGDGKHEVLAGGRRLRAITQLIEEGKLDTSFEVPCLVETDDAKIAEASLSENLHRVGMHPVDELEAFHKLRSEKNFTIADLAAHFGKSKKEIRKTLALGACAPELLDRCRQGEFDPGVLRAFAINSDHEKQLAAYEAVKNSDFGHTTFYAVRDHLTDDLIDADSKLVRFVTLDAYKKAGGRIQTDLFQEDTYLLDGQILNDLVEEKAKALIDEHGDGWSWCNFDPDANHWGVPTAQGEDTEDTKALQGELKIIEEKLDAAGDPWDIEDDEKRQQATAVVEDLEEQINELEEKIIESREFTEQIRQISGVLISLNHQGELVITKGALNEEQAREYESSGGTDDTSQPGAPAEKPKYSPAVCADLDIYKTEVARMALVANPLLATEVLHFDIVISALRAHAGGVTGLSLGNTEADTSRKDITSNEARMARREDFEHQLRNIDKNFMELINSGQYPEAFALFVETDSAYKSMLLGHAAALTLSVKNDFAGYLLVQTDFKIRDYWRPTAANFFNRVNKDTCTEIAADIMGETWAEANSTLPKKELAARLEAECENGKPGQGWIPEPMMTRGMLVQSLQDDEEGIAESDGSTTKAEEQQAAAG